MGRKCWIPGCGHNEKTKDPKNPAHRLCSTLGFPKIEHKKMSVLNYIKIIVIIIPIYLTIVLILIVML